MWQASVSGGLLSPVAVAFALGTLGVTVPAPVSAQNPQLGVTEITSFGVESGNPLYEFGEISGFQIDVERRHIYLFDRQNLRLSVFSHDGRFIAAVGRRGAGPGEFRGAMRVAGPVNGTAYVPDHINTRLSRWALRSDSLVLVDEIRASHAGPTCHIGDHLYFFTYGSGRIIQKVDLQGNLVLSFGGPFRSETPGLAAATANGPMVCDSTTGSVFIGGTVFPYIRRYNAQTGRLVWQAELPGMIVPEIRTTAEGLPMYRAQSGRRDWEPLISIVTAPGSYVLAQIGSNSGASGVMDIVRVKTFVFKADDGRLLAVRTDLPRLDYSSGPFAYSYGNDPFPRVRVYRWR